MGLLDTDTLLHGEVEGDRDESCVLVRVSVGGADMVGEIAPDRLGVREAPEEGEGE